MNISTEDIAALREIGKKYMEIASLPIQKEKILLWKSLNRSQMQRPMVVLDQLPWNELDIGDELTCKVKDEFWRNIEYGLRCEIYKWTHFPADMVFDPFIRIPKAIKNSGFGLKWKEETLATDETNSVVSHKFENQLVNDEDADKIKDMVITHDENETELRYEQAKLIFDGIAPIKMVGMTFHLGVWDYISEVMGVQDAYFALLDRPEFIHKVMDKLTNSTLSGIKQCNDLQLHDDIVNACHCSYIYTDELLQDSGLGHGPNSKNCWAFGLAQLFSSCSPEVTEEFEIPYITKMAEQFGMIYYGCCDRLDDRLDLVKKIPNVRKVSCSPWSKKAEFSEQIGKKLIISNKPNPAFLATDIFDEDIVRKDLEETCKLAKANGANLEIIIKDVSTVRYQPQRLIRWADIAMEVVNNY